MDEQTLRAWWWHRQGLDGSLEGASPSEVLMCSGWARSVGGVGPYLTLFARAGISREQADAAVAELAIHELPAARGCTYVVPAPEFALALKAGEGFGGGELKVAMKLGVTQKEIDTLCGAILKALKKGELEPDQLRTATGTASRSLGEEGKKKGVTTTMPIALGILQGQGKIRRVPLNGRLDQQRYRYALWANGPLEKDGRTVGDALVELARRFFSWVGPATADELQWFTGQGVKVCKGLVEQLKLQDVGDGRLLHPEDAEAFAKFKPPTRPQYALVSSLDALSATRRNVATLVDAKDLQRRVQLEKGLGTLGGISDLPNHAIFDRGRLVGLWEFDPEAGEIVWASFGVKDKGLDAAVKRTEAFIRDQLGDARSFSLDSPKSRAPKLQALRKLR